MAIDNRDIADYFLLNDCMYVCVCVLHMPGTRQVICSHQLNVALWHKHNSEGSFHSFCSSQALFPPPVFRSSTLLIRLDKEKARTSADKLV